LAAACLANLHLTQRLWRQSPSTRYARRLSGDLAPTPRDINGSMVRLENVLDSWKAVREDTAQAVEDFPANELDFKPLADVASFREIARHILEAGHALSGMIVDGVDNLAVPEFRQMIGKYVAELPETPDAASLGKELRAAVEQRAAQLAAQPAAFFAQEITRFDGQRVTRLEMLQGVKEHELTHRSQLFMYLRMKGVVPATTRRRIAKAKA
jgi:uncharacterized damage-inducible protein DinB